VGTGVKVVSDHYVGYMSCISHAGTVNHIGHSDRNKWDEYTGCVSELGDFATLFFSGSATPWRMSLSPFCCQL
jgi:hypothetical protein